MANPTNIKIMTFSLSLNVTVLKQIGNVGGVPGLYIIVSSFRSLVVI